MTLSKQQGVESLSSCVIRETDPASGCEQHTHCNGCSILEENFPFNVSTRRKESSRSRLRNILSCEISPEYYPIKQESAVRLIPLTDHHLLSRLVCLAPQLSLLTYDLRRYRNIDWSMPPKKVNAPSGSKVKDDKVRPLLSWLIVDTMANTLFLWLIMADIRHEKCALLSHLPPTTSLTTPAMVLEKQIC